MKKLIYFTSLVLIVGLAGCASPARVDSMVAHRSNAVANQPVATDLVNNIRVASVLGGENTNPLWTSQISSNDFKQALEKSLDNAGLLNALRTGGDYELSVTLVGVDQPLIGINMTVKSTVHYRLVRISSRETLMDEEIARSYTAKFGDHLLGVERLRLANEGSARVNISTLIEKLFALNIAER